MQPEKVKSRDSNICTPKFHSSVHNSQKVETTQMSIDERLDKQNAVYPYNGTLILLIRATTWMKLKH